MAEDHSEHSVSMGDIKMAIADILQGADLNELSSKTVRKQLEERFNADLSDRKKEIDKCLMDMIDEKTQNGSQTSDEATSDEESEDEDADEPAPKKAKSAPKTKAAKNSKSSNRPSPGKSKKAKSQEVIDSGAESEDGDEALAKRLQEEEQNGGRRTRKGKPQPKAKKVTEKKEKKERKGTSTYSKPCRLSPALSEVVGANSMPRSDVVKFMWNLVKERNLKDPKNGQFMICDDQLHKIFGRKRLRTFGMMKFLKNHIFDDK